ncbi:MAG: hypothetical protein JWL65_4005 [Gammaproteobacteria bacterium]|nr:hypothetical protein [Gammaproteobacteria bacterium]
MLGLTDGHLRDAMTEVARYLLVLGAHLVYGGDLRQNGFSELLFELVARHCRDSKGDTVNRAINYLAWPVHIAKTTKELQGLAEDLDGTCVLACLKADGRPLAWRARAKLKPRKCTAAEWATSLTAMRKVMLEDTQARIVMGGQVEGFQGAMPGIAEEALLSLRAKQPLFVLGGFGGCARDICESLRLPASPGTRREWPHRADFEQFSAVGLHNGLDENDNATLARTPHVDQAVILIMRGLMRSLA